MATIAVSGGATVSHRKINSRHNKYGDGGHSGGEGMKKVAEKLLTNAPPIILLILMSILVFPAYLMATGPKQGAVGHAQEIREPEKLQRALYALLQKADVQRKIINNWHRKALLATTQVQAKNCKQDTKAMATDSSRRASDLFTTMVAPDQINTRWVENLFRIGEKTKVVRNSSGLTKTSFLPMLPDPKKSGVLKKSGSVLR